LRKPEAFFFQNDEEGGDEAVVAASAPYVQDGTNQRSVRVAEQILGKPNLRRVCVPVCESRFDYLPCDFTCFRVATLCHKLTLKAIHLLCRDELVPL